MLSIPIILLLLVFIFITGERLSPIRLPIWLIMFCGGALSILLQQISLTQAWHAINWNLIGFLFGVFLLAEALEKSHVMHNISIVIEHSTLNSSALLLCFIFVSAAVSALLMNDTMAIIGIPLCFTLSRSCQQPTSIWLLALAFAVTIGSVISPIGNPQNLFIALHIDHQNPFALFFSHFWLISLINLLVCFILIRLSFHQHFHHNTRPLLSALSQKTMTKNDYLVISSLGLFVSLTVCKIILFLTGHAKALPFFAISLLSSIPIIVFHQQRRRILMKMDWGSLFFFIGLFILMRSVWLTGLIQTNLHQVSNTIHQPAMLLSISVILSQLISNVPTAALLLPWLQHLNSSTSTIMTLAYGSTIAGNFSLLGAASTMIIMQGCQKRNIKCFTALRLMAIGIPLGLINLVTYGLLSQ